MFKKVKKEKELDFLKLNEVITLSKNILSIVYLLAIIIVVYLITILFKEWGLKQLIISLLAIVSPLFIGFFVAWLFDPFVTWLQKKGVRRGLGTLLIYVIFLSFIILLLGTIIPLLTNQINDLVKNVPNILDSVYVWIDNIFNRFQKIESLDIISIKNNLFSSLATFGTSLTDSLPDMTIKFIKSLFSVLGTIVIGLIIGFYLLMNFSGAEAWIIFVPKKLRDDTKKLLEAINNTCRSFVTGALLDSLVIFTVSSLAFFITGLKAPLLFGLFCGITNVIPYAGPYIGGIPAVIVAFSTSTTCGIFTLISLVVIQGLEGNLLQPLIMAKSTKLHPVTIMLGLLIFGHFFGILGMVISTPTIGVLKAIFNYFEEKYDWFGILEEKEVEYD